MHRPKRVIHSALLLLAAGALINLVVAQGIGLSGAIRYKWGQTRFVQARGALAEAHDMSGPGWHAVDWLLCSRETAAVAQYMYDKHLTGFDGRLDPSYLHPDPADTLPSWLRLWDDGPGYPAPGPRGQMIPQAFEVGVGWPFITLRMDRHAAPGGSWHGGSLVRESGLGGLHVLAWSPVARGLALGTLTWTVSFAAVILLWRRVRARRRTSRGSCPACGYDRRGLAHGATCPECGATSLRAGA